MVLLFRHGYKLYIICLYFIERVEGWAYYKIIEREGMWKTEKGREGK